MRISRVILLLLVLVALFQYSHYEPLLPDRVATHFNDSGQPNGWAAKNVFLLGMLGAVLGVGALFAGIGALVPKLPDAAINLPDRDYWLAPERRAATMGAIQRQFEWFAAATMLYVLAATQLNIEANFTDPPALSDLFMVLFVGYMVFILVWMGWLIRWTLTHRPKRQAKV